MVMLSRLVALSVSLIQKVSLLQSLDNPARPATAWPKSSGTWYINHSMILDPDPTAKQAYLRWAATRRVAEVYIAPHAGQFALVAIPVRNPVDPSGPFLVHTC